MLIQLKEAKLSDLLSIYLIQKAAFKSLFLRYQDGETSPYLQSFEKLNAKFSASNTTYYLIMTAQKTVGFLKLTVEQEHTTKLSSIALLPSYENRGIGRQAMTLIERNVQTDTIHLNTILQEPKLVHFYHSLGYSQTGRFQSTSSAICFVSFTKKLLRNKKAISPFIGRDGFSINCHPLQQSFYWSCKVSSVFLRNRGISFTFIKSKKKVNNGIPMIKPHKPKRCSLRYRRINV